MWHSGSGDMVIQSTPHLAKLTTVYLACLEICTLQNNKIEEM